MLTIIMIVSSMLIISGCAPVMSQYTLNQTEKDIIEINGLVVQKQIEKNERINILKSLEKQIDLLKEEEKLMDEKKQKVLNRINKKPQWVQSLNTKVVSIVDRDIEAFLKVEPPSKETAYLLSDGTLVYPFGIQEDPPIIYAQGLRLSAIELEKSEKVIDIHIGDNQRWNVSSMIKGVEQETIIIVVKPLTYQPVETNLMVSTDQRIYNLKLIGNKEKYNAKVKFFYPHKEPEQKEVIYQETDKKNWSFKQMNFAYEVSIKNMKKNLKNKIKLNVFDNTQKVFIHFPYQTYGLGLPVLMRIGKHGQKELLNYRYVDNYFVVDTLFDKAHLLWGENRVDARIEIQRVTA